MPTNSGCVTGSASYANADQGDDPQAPLIRPEAATSDPKHGKDFPLWTTGLICILLNFLVEMFDQIIIVPQIALLEGTICRAHYGAGYSPGFSDCTVDFVQHRLARLRSWKAFFETAAVLVVSMPLAAISDNYGRKKVLFASLLASSAAVTWTFIVCRTNLPAECVWLSALFFCFGNLSSANATIYTMAADSTLPSRRSQYFYYLYSTFLVCELIAPTIISTTMELSVLIPLGVGFGCLLIALLVILMMPETLRFNTFHARAGTAAPPVRPGSRGRVSVERARQNAVTAAPMQGSEPDSARGSRDTPATILSVLRQGNVLMALAILFLGALRPALVGVLFQYTTTRFGWSLGHTAMLVSEIAIVNVVLFLFLLPQFIAWLSYKYEFEAQIIDYGVVLASLATLAIGAFLMGTVPSVTFLHLAVLIFAAGYGTRVATLSLITLWVPDHLRSRAFAAAQITENLGRMVIEPSMLGLFAVSLQLRGFWRGLPFIVGSGLFGVGAMGWALLLYLR